MQSFNPPIRTLMGPGPSDVHPRVTAALSRPTIGHLDPAFIQMMDEIKEALKRAFCTDNAMTFPISAPGSAGMEACFANLVEPEDTVIVCQNGVFGARMKENVERAGGTPVMVQNDWGTPVDIQATEDALKAHPEAKILAFVHAETSTGVRSDAEALCRLAREHDCLTIVDAVTSLAGIQIDVDGWQIDAIYSGSQKCLSCPPGLSPVSFGERALETVRKRKSKVRSWFLDLSLLLGYWDGDGGRAYHHTAPINALYGLHESLVLLEEEGLQATWARHLQMHNALKAGLEAMGLSLLVDPKFRLPQLNTVNIPGGIDEAEVRRRLLSDYNLEIGAGLGALAGKVWRVGLMGHSARVENVILCLSALEHAMKDMQAPIKTGVAVEAAQATFA